MKRNRSLINGVIIILVAAFIWGIGNTVTGLTAQKYVNSGSLFPAVEIALANTIGGLAILLLVFYFLRIVGRSRQISFQEQKQQLISLINKHSIVSGALKGANTCLFVFSTTYIAATQSLILESTYIVWTLLLGVIFLTKKAPLWSTVIKTVLLFTGVILVSGQTNLHIGSNYILLGAVFGLCAGISYALYLFFWSFITKDLTDRGNQIISTVLLLSISSITIFVITEVFSLIFHNRGWLPFTHLAGMDILVQTVNGIFVVGCVYLLITIGMTYLKNAQEGAGVIAAFCLSFSIPFTLIAEAALGKFIPTGLQLFGVLLFMIGFVLMSTSLSESRER